MLLTLLGRHGDLVNCLPLAYALSRQLGAVKWLVGAEYAGTLEGVSYVSPVIWPGGQDSLRAALQQYRGANPTVVQTWLNPDEQRLTPSYALEQWRLAGRRDDFGAWPLLFDRANVSRANMLRDRVLSRRHPDRPLVLACVDGVSSPFLHSAKLLAMLRGLDVDVIDLGRDVRADRVFDLLPLFEAADCLVSIDTMPLHLARATCCPVVALLNDAWDGWRASVPPPQTLARFTYSEAAGDLAGVVSAVAAVAMRPRLSSLLVAADVFDHGERATKARAAWPRFVAPKLGRSSKAMGDSRSLPFMRDILQAGLDARPAADVICWTNDDCAFTPGALDKIQAHAGRFDFGCVRRDAAHVGREAFWFSRDWLAANLGAMPDVILGTPLVDLILAKWLRGFRGIKSTPENMGLDFPPVELPPGLIYHAPHESRWLEHQDSASARHNADLYAAGSSRIASDPCR